MNQDKPLLTPWQRFVGILRLEKRDLLQVIYYAVFSGLISLTLPLGIQAIINLIQGAQVSTSWIVLVILVTLGVVFVGVLQLMQMRIIETVQQRIFMRASFEFTYRFPKIRMNELRNYYPPELANRFFDVLTVQKGLAKLLLDVPSAVLQIVFALILLSFYHPFFIAFGILLGGLLVLNQEMNIGQFVAAEIIILLVIASVEKLILGLESFYDVLTSLEKMGQVVDKKLESQDGINVDSAAHLKIELDKVTYEVPNRASPILNDISITIKPSSRVMIQGPSGSGKSSLLRVISGIIEPTKGRIFVNDESLQNIHLNNYRSCLGLSLAEETPFEGSIRDNLTLTNNISDEEVNKAIEIVGLRDYLKQTEKGLETIIYPEGKQMSFTVAKKIILARAILKKPKVLILEEPLEHFEASEAKRVIKALTASDNPWALIVASFNKDWESECTKVINLNNGEII